MPLPPAGRARICFYEVPSRRSCPSGQAPPSGRSVDDAGIPKPKVSREQSGSPALHDATQGRSGNTLSDASDLWSDAEARLRAP